MKRDRAKAVENELTADALELCYPIGKFLDKWADYSGDVDEMRLRFAIIDEQNTTKPHAAAIARILNYTLDQCCNRKNLPKR